MIADSAFIVLQALLILELLRMKAFLYGVLHWTSTLLHMDSGWLQQAGCMNGFRWWLTVICEI